MGNVKEKLNAEERAYRLLTETIKQSYKPGDFILESSLAIDFGMSRTPISIALNRLVSEGILKKVPKKGSYIPLLECFQHTQIIGSGSFEDCDGTQ